MFHKKSNMKRQLKVSILFLLSIVVIILTYSKEGKIISEKELTPIQFLSRHSFSFSNSAIDYTKQEKLDEDIKSTNFDTGERNNTNTLPVTPKTSLPVQSFPHKNKDTNKDKGNLVIYNRISKCGSMTMISLIYRLAKRNNFDVSRTIDIKKIVNKYNPGMKNTIFIEHKEFQPVPLRLREKITYINVWRDPIGRYISGYHYFRDHLFKKYVSITKRGEIMIIDDKMLHSIQRNWIEKNIHTCGKEGLRDGVTGQICLKGMKYLIKDSSVIRNIKSSARAWLEKSLASCVNDSDDPECNDFSVSRPRQVELKNVILKWHAGKDNLLYQGTSMPYPPFYYKPSAGEYLCGYQSFCLSPNSKKARMKSISNIDSHYSVVGTVEEMTKTLAVLENRIPQFFTGALEEYKNMKHEKRNAAIVQNNKWATGKVLSKINTGSYDDPSQKVIEKLKRHFTEEYRVYDYVVERLNKQYSEIVPLN